MPLYRQVEIGSMEELNSFFSKWLEGEYHRKAHSGLNGMTPLDKYLSQASAVKGIEDPKALKLLFLKREYRKVKHDSTVSIKKKLFEVPPEFIGQKIELRFDDGLNEVFVFCDGKKLADAKALDFADNARVKRDKPPLSFKELFKKGVDPDV